MSIGGNLLSLELLSMHLVFFLGRSWRSSLSKFCQCRSKFFLWWRHWWAGCVQNLLSCAYLLYAILLFVPILGWVFFGLLSGGKQVDVLLLLICPRILLPIVGCLRGQRYVPNIWCITLCPCSWRNVSWCPFGSRLCWFSLQFWHPWLGQSYYWSKVFESVGERDVIDTIVQHELW